MDEELKTYLEEIKRDLSELREEMKSDLSESREQVSDLRQQFSDLREQFSELRQQVNEHVSTECEKLETKLLTEFHKWGSTSDMRTRHAITETAILGERMLAVEDRVSALERQRRAG